MLQVCCESGAITQTRDCCTASNLTLSPGSGETETICPDIIAKEMLPLALPMLSEVMTCMHAKWNVLCGATHLQPSCACSHRW